MVVRLIINAVALWAAAYVIQGIDFGGEGQELIVTIAVVAAIFSVINTFIKPIANNLACALNVLTLGLFRLVINALMLLLTAYIAGEFGFAFTVTGFREAFFGSLIVSIVSILLDTFTGGDDD